MNGNCADKTRREELKEERRNAILAVARQAFHEQGYGGTTMSAIAAALGGSKGTLWAYFPSKEALFAATMDTLVEKFHAAFNPDPVRDVRPVLTEYCVNFITMLLSPPIIALNRLIIGEAARFPELGRIFYERGPGRRQRLLADYLMSQMALDRLKPVDAMVAAIQLHFLCQVRLFSHTLWGLAPEFTPEDIRKDAETAVALFLDGYGTGESLTR